MPRSADLRPLLLRADNFTPPARTPWGGTRILQHYKAGLPLAPDKARYPVVGESWEISVEPDFPSHLADGDIPLSDVLARNPVGMLGPDAAARRNSTALLVKLLDAADELSVQIHPRDDYAGLEPDQSGKPESWYVLDAEPGAGLYLGLRHGVTRQQMREALERQQDVSSLLGFVQVQPGDFFVIDAGTAHAIGRGVTLVEPQRVVPGRRGVTYRYWDWNRRYDADGRPDPDGAPRRLHVEQALDVTAWDAPREQDLLAVIRHRAGPARLDGAPALEPLCGPDGPVPFEPLRVARLTGTGTWTLSPAPWLRGLTLVAGAMRLYGDRFEVAAEAGRSLVLPAGLEVDIELQGVHAIVSAAD